MLRREDFSENSFHVAVRRERKTSREVIGKERIEFLEEYRTNVIRLAEPAGSRLTM